MSRSASATPFAILPDLMVAADAPHLEDDCRPAYMALLAARAHIAAADKPNARIAQQRLFLAHMYTDDPINAVVGVQRALCALH
eukprot:6185804-Pleurochrysis_carterae.AAC.1